MFGRADRSVVPWASATLLLFVACTRVSDEERFEAPSDLIEIVETVPHVGELDVASDIEVDLCFSALVDPRTVEPGDARVRSGAIVVDAKVSLEIRAWRGPGSSTLTAVEEPWCDGSVMSISPQASLQSGLLYRAQVVPRARGWNGERLDTDAEGWTRGDDPSLPFDRLYYLEFTVAAEETTGGNDDDSGTSGADDTGTATDDVEDLPEGPTLTELFAPGAIFDPERELCSCHRGSDELATARLDLSDPDTAYADLVLDPRPRDTGFPMVSLRRPSESFLVHKLLREKDGDPLRGVLGDAMPKDGELPYADYVAIARWIAAGAER